MHEEKQIKKWVWVPHNSLTYIPAFINSQNDKETIVTTQDNQILSFPTSKVQKMNPQKFNMADDLAILSFLNDASVLHNLRMRYEHDLIYTFSGLFLVAINPYKEIKNLYSKETIKSYKNKKHPHIFAIANDAYENMVTNKENQSILITGESGAGKTENTKKVITFLAHIANKEQVDSSVTEELIANKILETNYVLEAFGNAQTVKNDNSSRFGKFIKISFVNGKITGCHIEKYLLEKSRITRAGSEERNYHVFYYLLEALRKNEKYLKKNQNTDLSEVSDYHSKHDENIYEKEYVEFLSVLKKGAMFESISLDDYAFTKNTQKNIKDVDDCVEFYRLNKSMDILDFSRDEKISIFKILAAILYLGNLEFVEENDQAFIANEEEAEKICRLLKIPLKKFLKVLLTPTTIAGKELVINSRTKEQVVNIVEALARLLYERMFDMIIDKINVALGNEKYYNKSDSNFIGVLDIAGFEIFEKNDFEQLCINFTNEKLQQFFNHHMFVLEQEIYKRENIDWDFIDFGLDLQPTIDLIEKSNPIGILSYLDEECVMPKGSDLTFLEKLREIENRGNKKSKKRVTFSGVYSRIIDSSGIKREKEQLIDNLGSHTANNRNFELSKLKNGFIIEHYAGRVEYIVDQWLKKNKDPHFDNLSVLLKQSNDVFVSELFAFDTSGKKGFFRTVSQKHKDSLNLLMTTLRKTNPFFVRCLLPNNQKKPNLFFNSLVLHQLKCNGVMEGIRISRQGYPTRILFKEFRKRYGILCSHIEDYIDNKEASLKILETVKNHLVAELTSINERNDFNNKQEMSDLYKVGNTMLFFKQGVLAEIEELRDRKTEKIAIELQSLIRRHLTIHREYIEEIRAKAIKIIQKNARLSIQFRNWNWWKLFIKVKPLLNISKMEDEIRQIECDFNAVNETLRMERLRYEELSSRLSKLNNEKLSLENDIEKERLIIVEKEDLLMALREENAQAKECILEKKRELGNLRLNLEENKAKFETLKNIQEQQRKNFEAENLSLRDKIKLLESNMNKLQTDSKEETSNVVNEKNEEIKILNHLIEELEQKHLLKENHYLKDTKAMEEKIRTLQDEIDTSRTTIMSLEKEVKAFSDTEKVLKTQINNLNALDARKQETIENLKTQLLNCESDNIKMYSENEQFKNEIDACRSVIDNLRGQKDLLEIEKNKLSDTLVYLQKDMESEKAKSGTIYCDNEELANTISLMKDENQKLKVRLVEEKEKADRIVNQKECLLNDVKDYLIKQTTKFNTLEANFFNQAQKLKSKIAELEGENKSLRSREKGVSTDLLEKEIERRKAAEKELYNQQSQNLALLHKIDVLSIENENQTKRNNSLQKRLEDTCDIKVKLAECQKAVEKLHILVISKIKQRNTAFDKILNEYRHDNSSLNKIIMTLNVDFDDLKEKNNSLNEALKSLTILNDDLKAEVYRINILLNDENNKKDLKHKQLIENYNQLKASLTNAEMLLEGLQTEKKRATNKISMLGDNINNSSKKHESTISQLKNELAETNHKFADIQNKYENLLMSLAEDYVCAHCTLDNCLCTETCLVKCAENNQYKKTINDLKTELCFEQDRTKAIKAQNQRLQQNYDTFTQDYNELKMKSSNQRSEVQRLRSDLMHSRNLLLKKESEISCLKNNLTLVLEEKRRLKIHSGKLQDTLVSSTFLADNEKTNKDVDTEKALRLRAEEDAKTLRKEIDTLTKTNALLLGTIYELNRKVEETEFDLSSVKERYIQLKRMYNESVLINERLSRDLRDEKIISEDLSYRGNE